MANSPKALLAAALALLASMTTAQASTKTISYSVCAGSDCVNNASQHNFTHPGPIELPTGLPSGFKIHAITYSCAAFCSHSEYWPAIYLHKGTNGASFTLDAHHSGSLNASSKARTNVLTLNIWLHY